VFLKEPSLFCDSEKNRSSFISGWLVFIGSLPFIGELHGRAESFKNARRNHLLGGAPWARLA
jgi:hypothetical protein